MNVIKAEQFTAFVASKCPGQIVTLLEASRDICSNRWIIACRVGDCQELGVWYATPEEIVDAQAATGVVYFPNVAEAIGAYAEQRKNKSAAMHALASVMRQVHSVLYRMGREDYQFKVRGHDRAYSVNLNEMNNGGMARAAARWSAQVRAKVKERDEARRADVAVRCQGEED